MVITTNNVITLTLEEDARGQPQSVAHGDRKLKQQGTH